MNHTPMPVQVDITVKQIYKYEVKESCSCGDYTFTATFHDLARAINESRDGLNKHIQEKHDA